MTIDIRHTWSGSHSPKPAMKLRAGRISMVFENGNIRYISAGNHEIIRMVYSAVRDKEWLNVKPVITSEKIERYSDSFRIWYSCRYKSGDNEFAAYYIIEGKADSTITFNLEGETLTEFEKNRIGFCVLHPIEGFAGNQCRIAHSNGGTEQAVFPPYISPEQIFTDIRSMKWTTGGIECSLEFSGDIFETEDQRNWTDASYKTYSTPQALPSPVRLKKGEKIIQNIIFRAGESGQDLIEKGNVIEFSLNTDSAFDLPKIGIGRSTRKAGLTKDETALLKQIPFDHYRSDIYLFSPGWMENANLSVDEAVNLGYSPEMALFFDDNYKEQTDAFAGWLSSSKTIPSAIALFHISVQVTPGYLAEYAAGILKKKFPDIRIIIGTNANFAQLNMERPVIDHSDLVCYSIHPQEHASDNSTITENLHAQAYSVESGKKLSGEKGIWVSPVNLKRRFNANIENFEVPSDSTAFPSQIDSRMMSLFGACWTAGSIKYLGEQGVSGITYFETAGERGIMQGDYPTEWPDEFRSSPGMIFPVYHIFRWLLSDKSFNIIRSSSSEPLKADILALKREKDIKIIIFNPGNDLKSIRLTGTYNKLSKFTLETETYNDAKSDPSWIRNAKRSEINAEDPFIINPYSITFLEGKLET